jgi:hypothetical protein
MFYNRSMMEITQKSGAPAPDRFSFALPAPDSEGGGRGKTAKTEKRIDGVESRKRGGQPGNRNAVKTGRYTASLKARRRQSREVLRRARAALAEARAFLAEARRK